MWGSIVAAICCATPLLAIGLASVGLAAIVPYLDYILIPALLVFLLLAIYGWLRIRGEGAQQR
jgi:mercuric ion transport protein